MLRLIPGTVVEQMIGADAIVSPAMVAELKRFFGLDQPWWVQYGRWLGQLARGDLGTSWRTGKPVVELILERLPVTIELTGLAVAFSLVLGIAAGILSAVRRDKAIDNVTRVGTLLGLSVPVFWQGTMLILLFSLTLRWMPPVVWVDFFTDPRRNLTIMLLPALCLGTASAASIARTTRACMLDVLRSEYVRTASAKGLAGRAVILKHALKNALIPGGDGGRAPGGHPARGHRGRRGGLHAPGNRTARALVHLPARLSAHAEHHPVHRGDVHDHQPGGRPPVRLSRSQDPLQHLIRMLKKAHLLRWRPRPHAQRRETTPRVRPSGAASHLDLFEHPADFSHLHRGTGGHA
jgi:ABC-type dipeptide/oligopeptide/nickel transport system permease subunit